MHRDHGFRESLSVVIIYQTILNSRDKMSWFERENYFKTANFIDIKKSFNNEFDSFSSFIPNTDGSSYYECVKNYHIFCFKNMTFQKCSFYIYEARKE